MSEGQPSRSATRADWQARALLELTRTIGEANVDLRQALARITETAAEGVEVERVGVWLYGTSRRFIRCHDLYVRSRAAHDVGAVLDRDEYPVYFEALAEERLIAAGDAVEDPRTREFGPSYLRPNGIGAMLDAPIHRRGEVVGVVCHEHVGPPRDWTEADRLFAASIGDLAGRALDEAERREVGSSLRDSEERFRQLTENLSELVVGVDARGHFTYVSPNHRERVGLEPKDLVGRPMFERIHPDDLAGTAEGFARGMRTLEPVTSSFRFRHGDGRYRWYEGTGRCYLGNDGEVHGVITSRNVTERLEAETLARELQAQLSQAQRLEAVGRLAGGIAHDFNNLLTAILGHLEVTLAFDGLDGRVREELDGASRVVLRAADLTQQLLALGRNQAWEPQVLDVNEALEGLGRMMRRVIGEDVQLEIDLDPELPSVSIARTQLDQVLMNLVINCRDAMPRGGALHVRTRRVVLDEAFQRSHLGSELGPHVYIEVCDSGVGMDEMTRSRVFDPFFTTKEPGKGVGLGLSTVYQIVRDAGGVIDVESEPGTGTQVRLWFPAVEGPRVESREAPAEGVPDVAGSERILVVEDEASVRRLLERALRAQGYEVESAGDGRAALERLEALEGQVDLVLSDVVMPVMGGVELARHLGRTHPEVKLLLLSGYAPPGEGDEDADVFRPDRVLQKPFTTRRLLERVRATLEGSSPG